MSGSGISAEVHVTIRSFHHACLVCKALHELSGRQIGIEAFEDSWALFKIIAKVGSTAEHSFQIDVSALKEIYRRGELESTVRIPGNKNVADVLTKVIIVKNTTM